MIPRSQRILFWTLLGAAVLMAVLLMRLRERAHDRLYATADAVQTSEPSAPPAAPAETVTLLEASDLDGGIAPVSRKIPLPRETGARARVLLRELLADYASPQSKHPLASGPGVDEVFFMTAPGSDAIVRTGSASNVLPESPPAQTAIVNFTRAFAESHPSGIEPETLTLLSIIGTLRENFPSVGQVRFLVDGQTRQTLAGHADLTRVYLATGAENR